MRLHILSDLHLSVCPMERPQADADVVILAGDISRPAEAAEWAAGFGRPVLYVPGNHEFYGGSIDGTLAELRERCAASGVRLLDADSCVIGGVRFLGATLWTDFRLSADPEQQDLAQRAALRFNRDFSRIRLRQGEDALLTPGSSAALHAEYLGWLRSRLDEAHDGPTVVITHHAPSPRSIAPRFANSPINAGFITDLEALMGRERVALWIHGHTHDSFDYEVNGTRVVCNPRGYASGAVNENRAFDPHKVVEVRETASA
ncbi:metallophosphoesterase [Solimonas sp. K1W22B-7]|uniref:metallophosphoesterase n=1 Tax=Solimonas sp. K1W22B-7 TaxID=2303331 RepID=UPI000E3348E7|nr:metallophosphoesterase [Solimonas sp. K1W22B-7]AXQ30215.1 metallophosphoesterase [Solimonas sp. K1W22B-7]